MIVNTKAIDMKVDSSLFQEIRRDQLKDEKIQEIKRNIKEEKLSGFSEDDEGVLWYKGRIYVPNINELKDKILHEAHEFAYFIYPRGNKM
jgi:sortase (surface protein transpeptidase)